MLYSVSPTDALVTTTTVPLTSPAPRGLTACKYHRVFQSLTQSIYIFFRSREGTVRLCYTLGVWHTTPWERPQVADRANAAAQPLM